MAIRKVLFVSIFSLYASQSLYALSLAEQFKQVGYLEICDKTDRTELFTSLYLSFDKFIEFVQKHPWCAQKLYIAKERFIRSKERNYYSTDFLGFYDESKREGRNQISFYYSTHFYTFICTHYPEFKQIPEIISFFQVCCEIQRSYQHLFNQGAAELDAKAIFSNYGHLPILIKVVKYLPSYIATRPHYDGTMLSFFLDSTDNQLLLLSPYKYSFTIDDFSSPVREHSLHSVLLIPGTLLADFSINPTPHIVASSGKTRYATIAFAMRPHYIPSKNVFSSLPIFKH